MSVVVRGEEMAICSVANNPHIDPIATGEIISNDSRCTIEEVCRCGPAHGVTDVFVGRIGDIAVLVDKVPEIVGFKPEDFRSCTVACTNRRLVEVVEGRQVCFVEIFEAQVHHTVTACVACCASKYVVGVIDVDYRRVLDSCNAPSIISRTDEGTS